MQELGAAISALIPLAAPPTGEKTSVCVQLAETLLVDNRGAQCKAAGDIK
jgi:hypothetical protein